jgi:1-acyl-sn-glycerol-3-phosphate acyltransferase
VKRPGRIILEFLEPIPPGRTRPRVMAELERRIETATTALLREARSGAAPRATKQRSFRDAPKGQARNP